MKLFPLHPVIWSSLLVLWFSQCESEGHTLNACQEKMDDQYELAMVLIRTSAQQDSYEDLTDIKEKFICLLYPTNELNCSWSFNTLEKDAQLSVFISVCDDEILVKSLNYTSVERAGSASLILSNNMTEVILHLNKSMQNKWTSYTYVYDMDMLELLSPPPNIYASVKDGALVVSWGLPFTREVINPYCFEYQLDKGDQEQPMYLIAQQSYREPVSDATRTYKLRMRTRITNTCSGSSQWSEWSDTVGVVVHNGSTDGW
ncbi:uncharacterized protein LOC116335267 [Oreochromis aureus]|uniref:uncharacterized protein LOC116335267 n=1 Tax=Oreochromis aureus TaxID=47969 RepID=UPI0012BD1C18|nr:uncharacterized protein LOC116335267 [Oreochromis aureus]